MTPRPATSALPGDAGRGPAMRAWTVGTLRAALAGIPDDTLLVISAEDFEDPGLVIEQVVTSAGPGTAGWADGHGPGQGKVFGLTCQVPDGPIELRAGRARALTAPEPLHGTSQPGRHREPSPRPSRELTPRPGRQLEAEP